MKILGVNWLEEDSTSTLNTAARFSNALGAELHLAYVWNPLRCLNIEFIYPAQYEIQKREAQQALTTCLNVVEAADGMVKEAHLLSGTLENEAISLSERIGADMIIVSSQNLSFMRRSLLGSEVERIVHHAPCSVLVVRPENQELYEM